MQMEQRKSVDEHHEQQLRAISIIDADGKEITDPSILSEMMSLDGDSIAEENAN